MKLLLKNAEILTMVSPAFTGDIAIDNGKIVAVGAHLVYPDAEEKDLTGMTLMPGIVDAHTHVGMIGDSIGSEGHDGNEWDNPLTPELRAIDSINPYDKSFHLAPQYGITTLVTGPGSSNVLGGTFAAVKTKEGTVEQKLLRAPVAMKAAFGENVLNTYRAKKVQPETRMCVAALLRKALIAAQAYDRKMQAAAGDLSQFPDRDLGKEALAKVLRGEMHMKIHCHQRQDILTAIRICNEFNIRYTLDHCTEGYMIMDEIKEALKHNCDGIIIGPMLGGRRKVECQNLTIKAPKHYYDAGVPFAIMTDFPIMQLNCLLPQAAMAAGEGVPDDVILQSITINAARANQIADRVGSLEAGKDADIAVFTGNPLEYRSRCVMTVIDGEIVYNTL